MALRRLIAVIGWTLMIVVFLLSILIFLPAPNMLLWMVSLAAGEWSLWLIPLSAVGGLMALAWPGRSIWPRLVPIPLLLATTAAALAPAVAAHRTAAREGADISFGRYLFGRTQPDVEVTTGIAYAGGGADSLRLDLYRPTSHAIEPGRPMPAAVVIHGGSWRGGSRSELAGFDRWLAGTGRLVLDIDYTLAREGARFPAQGRDVLTALKWIGRNAARLGIDTGDVVLIGRSAGGHLALLAASDANRAAADSSAIDSVTEARPVRVRAVISLYAPTDLAWGYDHPSKPDIVDTRGVLENFIGGPPRTHASAYALGSPIGRFDSTMPPTLLIHGGQDRIVSPHHFWAARERLEAAGVPHRALFLPWSDHGFDVNDDGFSSQIAQRVMLDFLEEIEK